MSAFWPDRPESRSLVHRYICFLQKTLVAAGLTELRRIEGEGAEYLLAELKPVILARRRHRKARARKNCSTQPWPSV